MSSAIRALARHEAFYRNHPRIKYRHINEGFGRTLTFRKPPSLASTITDPNDPILRVSREEIPYVGTTGLLTCLGVYFQIDERRCFAAHINAVDADYKTTKDPKGGPTRRVDEQKGAAIQQRVVDTLNQQAAQDGWDPATLERPRVLESLILSCPQLVEAGFERNGGEVHGNTGWWVLQGLKQALKLPEDVVCRRDVGFVVNFWTRKKEFLAWRSGDERGEGDVCGKETGAVDAEETTVFEPVGVEGSADLPNWYVQPSRPLRKSFVWP